MPQAAAIPIVLAAVSTAASVGATVKTQLDADAARKKQKDLLQQAKEQRLAQERNGATTSTQGPGDSPGLFQVLGAPRA